MKSGVVRKTAAYDAVWKTPPMVRAPSHWFFGAAEAAVLHLCGSHRLASLSMRVRSVRDCFRWCPCSPRRWDEYGFLRTSLRNWGLVLADWLGLLPAPRPSPEVLRAGMRTA